VRHAAELRAFADTFVAAEVIGYCEDVPHVWTHQVRRCLASAPDAAALETCKTMIRSGYRRGLLAALATVEARLQRISDLAASTLDCKRAAAAHYDEHALDAPPMRLERATRNRLLAEMRTVLANACRGERWASGLRACIAETVTRSDGTEDGERAQCFEAVGDTRWRTVPNVALAAFGRCKEAALAVAAHVGHCDRDAQADPTQLDLDVAPVIGASCDRDQWSERRLRCLRAAPTRRSIDECLGDVPYKDQDVASVIFNAEADCPLDPEDAALLQAEDPPPGDHPIEQSRSAFQPSNAEVGIGCCR
jgi:hypothetical protein